MRLINSTTFELRKFDDDNDIPPYAIMSHTWRKDEVSLQDMAGLDESWKQKAGFQKIRYCCEQAVRDELKWAWVDTCCIDQSNSAELSKSINSMFRFYSRAKLCYAYLADISSDDPKKLRNSKWFTRGWTLQELIAPSNVIFYNASWTAIGTKRDLMHEISDITHIDEVVLGGGDLERVSVARKMSWAATRITTILEDMAYCLLGIFNVNMPLLYGEGERAFIRLQKHILEVSFDQSLFAWGVPRALDVMDPSHIVLGGDYRKYATLSSQWTPNINEYTVDKDTSRASPIQWLFARSPMDFTHGGNVVPMWNWPGNIDNPPILSVKAIHLTLPVLKKTPNQGFSIAILGCWEENKQLTIAILFKRWPNYGVRRLKEPIGIPIQRTVLQDAEVLASLYEPLRFTDEINFSDRCGTSIFINDELAKTAEYNLTQVQCRPTASWDGSCTIKIDDGSEGRQAVLLFEADQSPAFVVIIGQFVISDQLPIPKTLIRLQNFRKGSHVQAQLKKLIESPITIITNTISSTHSTRVSPNDSSDDQNADEKADFVIYKDQSKKFGRGNLNLWARDVHLPHKGSRLTRDIDISLMTSVAPKLADCATEENLTVTVGPQLAVIPEPRVNFVEFDKIISSACKAVVNFDTKRQLIQIVKWSLNKARKGLINLAFNRLWNWVVERYEFYQP